MAHDKGGIWPRSSKSGTSRASWGELYMVGKGNISYVLGLYRHNGQENGNYYKGSGTRASHAEKTQANSLGCPWFPDPWEDLESKPPLWYPILLLANF